MKDAIDDLDHLAQRRDRERAMAFDLLKRLKSDEREVDPQLAQAYRLHLFRADRIDAKLRRIKSAQDGERLRR